MRRVARCGAGNFRAKDDGDIGLRFQAGFELYELLDEWWRKLAFFMG